MAIKLFLGVRRKCGRVPRDKQGADPCTLRAWAGGLDGNLVFSAIKDVAGFVPELAPLVLAAAPAEA